MLAEKEYLKEKLKEAGIRSTIHTSMKGLERCSESHLGAVLVEKESFTRDKGRKRYRDGEKAMQRKTLFIRETLFTVVIGDSSESKCEAVLSEFLARIGEGFADNGNWVDIEAGEADWVPEGDSILRAKMACQLAVTCRGRICVDSPLVKAGLGDIEAAVKTGG